MYVSVFIRVDVLVSFLNVICKCVDFCSVICYTDYATQFNHKTEWYSQLVPLSFRLMELCSNNMECTVGVRSIWGALFLCGGYYEKA